MRPARAPSHEQVAGRHVIDTVRMQVAAQELLHVAIGNDATSSNPVAQDLCAFFQNHKCENCNTSKGCPGSIHSWLRFGDTHSLHVCGTSSSGAAAAAAWSMLKRSLCACSIVDKVAMLKQLPKDLQPDFVEAVLVDVLLPDVERAFNVGVAAHVSRSRTWPLLPQRNQLVKCLNGFDVRSNMDDVARMHSFMNHGPASSDFAAAAAPFPFPCMRCAPRNPWCLCPFRFHQPSPPPDAACA